MLKLFKQQFMKTNFFLVALLFLVSCKNRIEENNELPIPKSSLVELQYKQVQEIQVMKLLIYLGMGMMPKDFVTQLLLEQKY